MWRKWSGLCEEKWKKVEEEEAEVKVATKLTALAVIIIVQLWV